MFLNISTLINASPKSERIRKVVICNLQTFDELASQFRVNLLWKSRVCWASFEFVGQILSFYAKSSILGRHRVFYVNLAFAQFSNLKCI